MTTDLRRKFIACDACGRMTHLHLIDAKEDPPGSDRWERFECQQCYGPGWLPVCTDDLDPDGQTQREVRAFNGGSR